MRILSVLLILSGFLFFQACEPDYPIQPNSTVLGEGIDCGWLIKFNEKPADLPESQDNTYIAVNLEDKYQLADLEVLVTAREATEDELLVCTTLGPGYVQIFITDIF